MWEFAFQKEIKRISKHLESQERSGYNINIRSKIVKVKSRFKPY